MTNDFPSLVSLTKYIDNNTIYQVSVTRTDTYITVHYVKAGNLKIAKLKWRTPLYRLKKENLKELIDQINQ